jgi:ubiquinone biosynthesis protein
MRSKLWLPRHTYRYVSRYLEIARVLAKYGFSDLVAAIHLDRYLPFKKKLVRAAKDPRLASLSRCERARLALEDLGPTFIKFGQIMSNRPDLMPEDLILELKKLQESVPAFPGETARQLLEEELNAPIDSLFSDFSIAPIAAASISQVHHATLPSGESVAVKVQRPNIEQVIKTDLEIMFHFASLAEKHIEGMETIDPAAMVKEFERSIIQELDFTVEASHIETFSRKFSGDETVYVPRVYVDYTTKRVLTMEFIDGIKRSDRETLVQTGLDPKLIAAHGADSILKQVFEHGFFHADPHPGNMRILRGTSSASSTLA